MIQQHMEVRKKRPKKNHILKLANKKNAMF